MAVETKIIKVRRGLESELDASRLLPGEFGFATDTKRLFMGTGSGGKELFFKDDVRDVITPEQIQEAVNNYLETFPPVEVVTDYELSETSTNPIQNRVVYNALKNYYEKSETYTQEEINEKISLIPKFSIEPVEELPSENISETTVYLVKHNAEEDNLYTEYIYVNGLWESLGTQKVDLSGYAKKSNTLAGYGIEDAATKSDLAVTDGKISSLEEKTDELEDGVNELSTKMDNAALVLTSTWFIGFNVYGWGIVVPIVTNCKNISITAAQVFVTGGYDWTDLDVSKVSIDIISCGARYIMFPNPSSIEAGNGNAYLVKLWGTIS